jgi:two-component system chemotaxis sensor kinase CheA
MSELDDSIVKEFLVESYENLDQLDRDLVSLEQDPASRPTLSSVFRTIHTIKGTCGFLGFSRLESVAHAGESLLSQLRDGELSLTPAITTVLLSMVDAVRQMLASIERTRTDGDRDFAEVTEALRQAGSGAAAPAASPAPPAPAAAALPVVTPAPEVTAVPEAKAAPAAAPVSAPEPDAATPAVAAAGASAGGPPRQQGMFESLIQSGRLDRDQVELAARLQQAGDPRRLGEILVDMGVLHPDDVLQALKTQAVQPASAAVQSSIRVDVTLLEKLMNRVGELVLARNQILQLAATHDLEALPAAAQRLSGITSELQEAIMKTRMQPIRSLWNRLPRLARDAATACGKQVELVMEGAETELDRSVIEAIKDPITHLVRNAVDHGIELPAERLTRGKPAEGRLLLRAFHEGGLVLIEVGDDGGGIPVERVRSRALERGLVSLGQAERMTDAEWMNLIFVPGFSTAAEVTTISGRGVGMDVVKSNLERIGGSIEIQSRPGLGTLMKIKIPLTLAIIPALCVTAGGDDYAIPQANLVELVRLQGEAARQGIERIQNASVHRLRGMLLPLVNLSEWLGVESRAEVGSALIAVLQTDKRQFGLVVDTVGESREIIVKPLGRPVSHVSTYAGATILGDGHVALILDIHGIARAAGIVVEAGHTVLTESATAATRHDVAGSAPRRLPLLVFDVRPDWRAALPLRSIARIEEFDPAVIERVGDRCVVQYRGEIMPLMRLEQLLDPAAPALPLPARDGRTLPVLVCVHEGRSIGLVVERIVDIEEHEAVLLERGEREGLVASLVIGGRVTDVLDLESLLGRADPDSLVPPVAESSGAGA